MTRFFSDGGPIWMGILTLLLLSSIAIAIYKLWNVGKDTFSPDQFTIVKEIGLFALMLGIFFQGLGLYEALFAIEAATSVSPSVLANGIRVGMIPTLYGIGIYAITLGTYIGIIAYYRRTS